MQGEHGVYMPFEKIVQEESGETSPAAVKAATFVRHEGARDGWRVDQVQRHDRTHDSTFTRNWSRKPRVMEPRWPLKSRSQVKRMRKQLARHQFCQCKSKGASSNRQQREHPSEHAKVPLQGQKRKNNELRPLTSSGLQTLHRNQRCRSEHVCKPLC